jgi:hypothetical protein
VKSKIKSNQMMSTLMEVPRAADSILVPLGKIPNIELPEPLILA